MSAKIDGFVSASSLDLITMKARAAPQESDMIDVQTDMYCVVVTCPVLIIIVTWGDQSWG